MTKYDAWLVLNKPLNLSSNHAVQRIKRLLGKENKVGHAGTLDPLAEGILPIAIGEATKTVQYLMDAEKEYIFEITWGEERSTGDAEGEVTFSGGKIPQLKDIEASIASFIGQIAQTPPQYSALKINGQPAYKLARLGKEFELKQRIVSIFYLEILSHDELAGKTKFKVGCGKGTYIRTLAQDIARSIQTFGFVSELIRTKVGNFLINDGLTLAKIEELVHNGGIQTYLLPVNYGLGDILAIEVTTDQAKFIRNGVKLFLPNYQQNHRKLVQIVNSGVLQALVWLDNGVCQPIRIFNLN